MMNYTARPTRLPVRNGKRQLAQMSLANEIKKVRTLIDDTILTVEFARKAMAQADFITERPRAYSKEAASEIEGSLETLRQRRKELGSF